MPGLDFQDALDRFGADLSRWPAAEQALGEAMLQSQPAASAMLDEARRLEAFMRSAPIVRAPAGLAYRILSRATSGERDLPRVASPPTAAVDAGVALPASAMSGRRPSGR